ncbi:hypothetical protein Sgou_05330 [Streptomyces gougerotii]|uniref:Uncharacterized protein n=1 Tax=Streptomyces gougerotii TaxID=53448 RepID=A0A8H9HW35_9ACTN|nr:hypothetical protein Sgou_05330 [Streptomyces gougerotii]GGU91736.1 hypothetical protein GCM10010227_53820 [Streptomyces gougerotii]
MRRGQGAARGELRDPWRSRRLQAARPPGVPRRAPDHVDRQTGRLRAPEGIGTAATWNITGTAAVANLGAGPEEVFAALCAGQESRGPLRAFAPDRYRAGLAY